MNQTPKPPRLALKLFRWFCRSEYHRDIEGDLLELFYMNAEEQGVSKAKRILWKDILLLFRSGIIKSLRQQQKLNTYDMVKHTFICSIRNFLRHKGSFVINLTGLSTGLACALLIFLWVKDELSIDRFHTNTDTLYQVMTQESTEGGILTGEATPHLLAEALAEEVPEIEKSLSFSPVPNDLIFSRGDDRLKASGHFAGTDFFEMFSFPLIQGAPSSVLADKSKIVISESLALRLFKSTDAAMGKTLEWDLQGFASKGIVSGIFKDTDNKSTLQFDFIIQFEQFEDLVKTYIGELSWESYQPYTYVQLANSTSSTAVSNKLTGFLDQKTGKDGPELFLRAFEDKYLYNNFENGQQAGGRIEYVRLFSLIAIFIVLVACVNFMNLATAKASRRLKELGVKKAIGASKGTLMLQYIGESVILSFISLIAAIGLVALILPQFNLITGKALALDLSFSTLAVATGLASVTGILAGSYPAFFLSGMRTVTVLKGKLKNSKIDLFARKGLVAFQFIVSIVLIVCVTVVYKQVDFIQSKNLGYEHSQLVSFGKGGRVSTDLQLFLEQARALPGIAGISAMSHNMTQSGNSTGVVDWPGKNPEADIVFQFIAVDFDMLDVLGVEMRSGRTFSKEFATDQAKVIINETAMKLMGMQEALGKKVTMAGGGDFEILGVTKDFHFESLHQAVKPTIMMILPSWTNQIIARLDGDNIKESVERLSVFYKEFNEGVDLDLRFIDDQYRLLYQSEQQISTLSRYFAGMAIIISCLGLFGLVAFTADRRKKEIGIRKILGSKTTDIIYLLSREFTSSLLVAVLIAIPLSYWFVSNWLTGFEYRVNLEWWFFALSGLIALLIAWLTVGIQTLRSAKINPVTSLRNE